jgi:hypothetical protein
LGEKNRPKRSPSKKNVLPKAIAKKKMLFFLTKICQMWALPTFIWGDLNKPNLKESHSNGEISPNLVTRFGSLGLAEAGPAAARGCPAAVEKRMQSSSRHFDLNERNET